MLVGGCRGRVDGACEGRGADAGFARLDQPPGCLAQQVCVCVCVCVCGAGGGGGGGGGLAELCWDVGPQTECRMLTEAAPAPPCPSLW